MNPARKIALGILSPLFIVLLFATAFDIGFVRTATHPATVKKLVAESGIYDSVIPSVLQQTKSIDTGYGTISASDPAIVKAANQAISPLYIQQNTETVIDSVYRWLGGQTAQPDFKIDLAAAKTNFAASVAGSIEQKLSSLPSCTAAQTALIARSGQFDAVNATCLPRGITAASAAAQVQSGINGSKDVLSDTTISANSISLNPQSQGETPNPSASQQPLFERQKIKDIPKQYQRAKQTPLVLSILTVLVGVGVVFLSRTWQKGLRHVGVNLVIIGLIMLVFAWALNRTVSTKVVPLIKVDNVLLQRDFRNLANDLTRQIDKNYWYFGGVYTVLGAVSIAGAEIFRRRAAPAVAKARAAPETSNLDAPKPAKKT